MHNDKDRFRASFRRTDLGVLGLKKAKVQLIETLKEPSEAVGYLNAALDDGDIDGLFKALQNVVEAHDGM